MPLTIAEIKNSKPREKPFKLAHEKGLYLFITRTGAKSWRFKYPALCSKRTKVITTVSHTVTPTGVCDDAAF